MYLLCIELLINSRSLTFLDFSSLFHWAIAITKRTTPRDGWSKTDRSNVSLCTISYTIGLCHLRDTLTHNQRPANADIRITRGRGGGGGAVISGSFLPLLCSLIRSIRNRRAEGEFNRERGELKYATHGEWRLVGTLSSIGFDPIFLYIYTYIYACVCVFYRILLRSKPRFSIINFVSNTSLKFSSSLHSSLLFFPKS